MKLYIKDELELKKSLHVPCTQMAESMLRMCEMVGSLPNTHTNTHIPESSNIIYEITQCQR